MQEILKPCPFCGGTNVVADYRYSDVHCNDCQGGIIADTTEEAIKKWNSRIEK